MLVFFIIRCVVVIALLGGGRARSLQLLVVGISSGQLAAETVQVALFGFRPLASSLVRAQLEPLSSPSSSHIYIHPIILINAGQEVDLLHAHMIASVLPERKNHATPLAVTKR